MADAITWPMRPLVIQDKAAPTRQSSTLTSIRHPHRTSNIRSSSRAAGTGIIMQAQITATLSHIG